MLPNEPPENHEPPNPDPNKPSEPAAPQFATKDEFNAITQTLAAMQDTLKVLAQAKQTPVGATATPTPLDPDPTDEQLIAELQEGKVTSLKKLIKNTESRIRREEVEPLRAASMQIGASLTKQLVKLDTTMPHYSRYEKDIDAQLSQLAPEVRANPEAVKYAYHLVVGQHAQELIDEAAKKAVETKRATGKDILPGGSASRGGDDKGGGDQVPSIAELIGPEAAESLKGMGRTPDQHARSMGYKSYDEWAKFVVEQRKSMEATT